jgi:hypothetical protein
MKRVCATVLFAVVLLVALAVPAFADRIPLSSPGQHDQSCQNLPSSPGNASSARGSAFNENGGIAGAVYAPIAQYDVACAQLSAHQG